MERNEAIRRLSDLASLCAPMPETCKALNIAIYDMSTIDQLRTERDAALKIAEQYQQVTGKLNTEDESNRLNLVQATVNTIMNSCTGDTVQEKAFRNAARLIQNAIDGNAPDFEKVPENECLSCVFGPFIQYRRKTGKWIERNPQDAKDCRLIECSECGNNYIVGYNVPFENWIEGRNFCVKCGADMRGTRNESD